MQINNTFIHQANNYRHYAPGKETPKPAVQTDGKNAVETAGTVGMTPQEAIGRAQVHFCAKKEPEIKLTGADENFAKGISEIFRLNPDEAKQTEQLIKDFLQEYQFKALSDMKSDDIFEYANETAALAESLTETLNLSDFESTVLTSLLIDQIQEGDITKIKFHAGITPVEEHKYVRDFTPFNHIYQKNTDNSENAYNAFIYLENYAKALECKSIFDLFNKENRQLSKELIEEFKNPKYGKLNQNQRIELMLDLIDYSGKTQQERVADINIHKERDIFNDGMGTIVLADKIADKYGIEVSSNLLEILSKRQTKTETHKNGQPAIEIAYIISEKYDLPGYATKDIAKMIEEYENENEPEKFNNLLDALKKNI